MDDPPGPARWRNVSRAGRGARFLADWVAAWVEVRNEPRELIAAGARVIVLVHGRFQLADDCEGKALACEAVDLNQALALARR